MKERERQNPNALLPNLPRELCGEDLPAEVAPKMTAGAFFGGQGAEDRPKNRLSDD